MLDMSSRKQRKKIKSLYKDKYDNTTACKKLTKDMLIKSVEKLCNGHGNTKEPIIIISNGLTDKQINKLLTFKTN